MAKKEEVRGMFNRIAHRYDYLNHFLSLGIDRLWRRKLRRRLSQYQPATILDVATGTADLAIELVKLNPQKIVGVDIAETMLAMGNKKIERKNLQHIITLQQADSEDLPFDSNSFDAATISYGVRNFETPQKGLKEIHRVLKPGGVLLILEFGMPSKFPFKQAYSFYFNFILPFWGKVFSGSYESYKYLPESVQSFPYDKAFTDLLAQAGFTQTRSTRISQGITYLYEGVKG
ncbi:MAG: bifunctional demethylmenaquinone methyltransferase/2-methoxy-6-polyprenyl-1,4-benzoquinol methylase UbiE [Bacteroidota bacterium]